MLSKAANRLQPVKSVTIPKNKFRLDLNNEDGLQKWPEYIVPNANKLVHPFYRTPNPTERTILCIDEKSPQLFNGHAVLPAFMKDPVTRELTLVESKISFGTVKDVSKWVNKIYRQSQTNDQNKVLIFEDIPANTVRESRLDTESPLVVELDRFLDSHPEISIESLDSELSRMFIFKRARQVVYLDEVLLHILQRDTLTSSQWNSVLKVLPKYAGKEIDDTSMITMLIAEWVLVGRKLFGNETVCNSSEMLWQVIQQISESLNKDICNKFTIKELNVLLNLFLDAQNLELSRAMLDKLALRHNAMPSLPLAEKYMAFIDALDTQVDRKTKLYYMHILSPMFSSHLTSTMATILLPYCVHQAEIFALFDLALKSKYAEEILPIITTQFILRLSQLKESQIDNSLNISTLYNRLKIHYNNAGKIPQSSVFALVVALVANSNFKAIITLLQEQTIKDISKAIELVEKQSVVLDTFGFREADKNTLLSYLQNSCQ